MVRLQRLPSPSRLLTQDIRGREADSAIASTTFITTVTTAVTDDLSPAQRMLVP